MRHAFIIIVALILFALTVAGCSPLDLPSKSEDSQPAKIQEDIPIIKRLEVALKGIFAEQELNKTEEWFNQLLDAIESNDSEAIVKLFGRTAIVSEAELNNSINNLFDFWEGEMTSFEKLNVITKSSRHNGIFVHDEIVAYSIITTEDQYSLAIRYRTIHSADKSDIGIHSINLIKANNAEPGVVYWGSNDWLPGIFIES